jgi:hypothetical protein
MLHITHFTSIFFWTTSQYHASFINLFPQVMSGAFVVGLAATSALFWFNQENDPVKDMTIDNIEEYM